MTGSYADSIKTCLTSTYIRSLPFLRSRANKVYCLGTGNGLTEVLNKSKSSYFLNICLSNIIVKS